ncbi:MAG: Lrp/AsnC family transcriptional regulator [Pseudohongiellaceae bacterium]|jgi:Lrp/AsnC family leucine-responsive transcriptional regulator
MELDRMDRGILQVLQEDGRISNQDLAEKVGLSPSPCLRRVRQLEEAGIINKYVALVNGSALGLKMLALIQIRMDRHTPDRFAQFEETLKSYPQVLELILITGQSADYQVKVLVKDMEEYQDFLLNKITPLPGVSDVHSSFVLRQVIAKTELPIESS